MKNKNATWAIERKHTITGEIFYLSPKEVNWISVQNHKKYGTRYGRWTWDEATKILGDEARRNPDNFIYTLCLYQKIK